MPSAYNSTTPTGVIHAFGGVTVPAGWLLCDGTAYSQTTYAALFAAVGVAFGASGGNFNVPDLRGRFVRGTDNMGTGAAGRDPDVGARPQMNAGGNGANAIGSVQGHAMQSHYHAQSFDKAGTTGNFGQANLATDAGTCLLISYSGTIAYPGNLLNTTGNNSGNQGSDTRPINAYANYIIKY